ncbi:MAG: co-chaperone GroES [bacterium]
MNIKPIGDRVLVKPQEEEVITQSGIVLPDTVDKEKKAQGQVLALGNGEKLAKLGLKVGDVVIYEKWGGEEVKLGKGADEVEYKILPHDKVMAVIE